MTRFKELRRIEAAIERQDEPELRWALAYSEMRVKLAARKLHEKTWRQLARRIKETLSRVALNVD